jgi:ferritin
MLSDNMIKKLNYQMNREIYSGYLYVGMGAYAAELGASGVANWFNVQMQEEMSHAQKFYNYVNQQGGRVKLLAIEEPPQEFSSITDLFEKTLEHEKLVTSLINDLVVLAEKEKDKATETFLQWFVTEQVEEEANPTEILQKLKLAGGEGPGLFMIDNEVGTRIFTPPAAA